MKTLAALLLMAASIASADDGFLKWYKQFQNEVAKGSAEVAEGSEFPMVWEYGSIRKIEARAALTSRFDFYFPDDLKEAIATGKPDRLPNGMYYITWKARGNEYSLYFKVIRGTFALDSLSEGPP